MNTGDFEDYWVQSPKTALTPNAPALQIDTIEGVEPLDAQLGVADPKAVPDALYEPLFGEPTDKPLHTYAILDAAKVPNLPELLEVSGLAHRCLFKGDAFDELKDVAPWVVQLEDCNAFTRNLFARSDAQLHLWDAEPGIYLRSCGRLDDVWAHFRKFTRIQVEEDKRWLYFRFWEPRVAPYFFQSIKGNPVKVAQWFNMRGNNHIERIFGVHVVKREVWTVSPVEKYIGSVGHTGVLQLSRGEMDALERYNMEKVICRIKNGIGLAAPRLTQEMGEGDVREIVKASIAHSKSYGIVLDADIAYFAYLSCIHTSVWHHHEFYSGMNSILRDVTVAPYLKMDVIESRYHRSYHQIDTMERYKELFSDHPSLGDPRYFDDFRQSLVLDRSILLYNE